MHKLRNNNVPMHQLGRHNSIRDEGSDLYPPVIANFTTHGESHFYGLPCPSADSLDPMYHFFTFDVSNTIPKNMQKLPYGTFKPFLVYIHGFDP